MMINDLPRTPSPSKKCRACFPPSLSLLTRLVGRTFFLGVDIDAAHLHIRGRDVHPMQADSGMLPHSGSPPKVKQRCVEILQRHRVSRLSQWPWNAHSESPRQTGGASTTAPSLYSCPYGACSMVSIHVVPWQGEKRGQDDASISINEPTCSLGTACGSKQSTVHDVDPQARVVGPFRPWWQWSLARWKA